jgi:hypothetical protein
MRDLLTTGYNDVATGAARQVAHDRRLDVDASFHRTIVFPWPFLNRVRLTILPFSGGRERERSDRPVRPLQRRWAANRINSIERSSTARSAARRRPRTRLGREHSYRCPGDRPRSLLAPRGSKRRNRRARCPRPRIAFPRTLKLSCRASWRHTPDAQLSSSE